MSALEAALLILVMALPCFWAVRRQLDRLEDPEYLRRHGVVIVLERALEDHAQPIGEYMGHPIWKSVTFKGMLYRFDRVTDRRRRERIAPGELYLDPGLVYALK